jgi:hypothetical protein
MKRWALGIGLWALSIPAHAQQEPGFPQPSYDMMEPGTVATARLPQLEHVSFKQKLNSQLPLDTHFKDENGRDVTLGQYFDGTRPVVLAFVYHSCPMLCTQIMNGVSRAIKVLPFTPGKDFDAVLSFPGQLKQALKTWRGAIPASMGDHDVQVIQGNSDAGLPVKLYFDDETGLLVRQVRYTETPIGRNSWQIDYDDYRTVGTTGVKMPFKWRVLWQSGDSTVELTEIQPNVAVDAARFARPAAPAARPRTP